jgi:rhodanese-related sulfurtransferase
VERSESALTIEVGDLKRRLERVGAVVALDVRQPSAYAEYPGAIPGSVRIPPHDLPNRYRELPGDRLIVLYCT